jgi:RNA polymerase sigma-70 factor (ECF subfamily)
VLAREEVRRGPQLTRLTAEERPEPDALVTRARAGDADAWECLYRSAYPRLVAFAHHRLGSVEDARDAVSEAMTRAIAQIGRFQGVDGGFTPWLFGITRHVVADTHRRRARQSRVPHLDDQRMEPDAADAFMAHAESAILREAFGRLPDEEADLLTLRVVGGLTSEQVAAALGKKPSAVRMAQKRALARLRVFVEEAQRED